MRYLYLILTIAIFQTCTSPKPGSESAKDDPFIDFTGLYKSLPSEMRYSAAVGDSFRIYSATPGDYDDNPSGSYPLIILLDANAYFEPVVSELKVATLTQGLPPSVVVGIGYKDFLSLDSLRNRDYTFPVALPKDSFAISGGGAKFKEFIDTDLLPELTKKFRVDQKRIALVGHSLGGYFVVYYFSEAANSRKTAITNFVAASPSLHYYDGYLVEQIRNSKPAVDLQLRIYSSVGSIEREPHQTDDHFDMLRKQFDEARYPGIDVKLVEYSNFDHMDAAMPGFIKGIGYVLRE